MKDNKKGDRKKLKIERAKQNKEVGKGERGRQTYIKRERQREREYVRVSVR